MDKDKQPFAPESVDDDIDQLTTNSSFIPSDPDARLVHELRHVYKEDTDSLKRVWERLEHYSMQQQTSAGIRPETLQRPAMDFRIRPLKKSSSNAKYPASQLFTVLAATFIGVFLVGSLTWVLAITHPAGLGASKQLNILSDTNDPYPPFSGELALSDPLSDNSRGYGWQETSSPDPNSRNCQFRGGAYHVTAQNYYAPCHGNLQASNFTFEVQMQIIKGNCGGLSLRDTTSVAHAYNFEVCQNGSYRFNRFDNFSDELTVASGSSRAIVTGLGQSNVIAAVVNGGTFDLYVNHTKITTINDSSYSQGLFGVSAFLDTEVAYTNARMWTL